MCVDEPWKKSPAFQRDAAAALWDFKILRSYFSYAIAFHQHGGAFQNLSVPDNNPAIHKGNRHAGPPIVSDSGIDSKLNVYYFCIAETDSRHYECISLLDQEKIG
jgi:hypothetical protein